LWYLHYLACTMDVNRCRWTTPGGFPHEVPTPNIQDPLSGPHQELRGRSAHRSWPGIGSHKTPSEFCLRSHRQPVRRYANTPSTPVSYWLDCRPSPEHSWKHRPGRPNNRWIDQLRRDNNDTPPADLWRRSTMPCVVIREWRYGPRRLCVDDDDNYYDDSTRVSVVWTSGRISRKLLEIEARFQRTINRKLPVTSQMVTWPTTLHFVIQKGLYRDFNIFWLSTTAGDTDLIAVEHL